MQPLKTLLSRFRIHFPLFCLLLLIALFAFFLRSKNFSTSIPFDSDFGRDSLFSLRIIRGDFTLLGPQASVGGFYLAPLYFYLTAGVYSVFGLQPPIMSIVFILMGVFTVVLGFLILSRHVSRFAGALFVLLSLFHPALVVASRTATNQPMMPLVTVVFIGVYLEAVKRQKSLWFFFTGLAFGLFFHVHFSALLLLPAVGLLTLFETKGKLKQKIVSALLFTLGIMIMISPLLLFDFSHGFITSKAFFQYISNSATGQGIAENHPHYSLIEKLGQIGIFTIQHKALSVLSFLLLVVGLWSRRKLFFSHPVARSLSLISIGSLMLLLLYSGYLYDYYLLIPMTLFLFWIATIFSFLKPRIVFVVLILLISVFQWRGLRYPEIFRTQENIQIVVDRIKQDIDQSGKPAFTVFKDSSDRLTGIGYEYRFLLEKDGYSPVFEQSYEKADVLYYIREEGEKDPLVSTNWETTQFGATKKELLDIVTTKRGKVPVYRLTR